MHQLIQAVIGAAKKNIPSIFLGGGLLLFLSYLGISEDDFKVRIIRLFLNPTHYKEVLLFFAVIALLPWANLLWTWHSKVQQRSNSVFHGSNIIFENNNFLSFKKIPERWEQTSVPMEGFKYEKNFSLLLNAFWKGEFEVNGISNVFFLPNSFFTTFSGHEVKLIALSEPPDYRVTRKDMGFALVVNCAGRTRQIPINILGDNDNALWELFSTFSSKDFCPNRNSSENGIAYAYLEAIGIKKEEFQKWLLRTNRHIPENWKH